jgi:threonine/homoserine/homoserine lactone efflux protein
MKDIKQLLKIALAGMGISLCGALPLGTLNTTAMQIAIEQGGTEAMLFALGVLLIEMTYLSITLYAVNWIRKHQQILIYAERLMVFIFLMIAGASFYKAFYPSPETQTYMIREGYIAKGILLSAVNPAQFPFWVSWNTALISRGLLQASERYYVSYIGGAGVGTFLGLAIFIATGNLLQRNFTLGQQYIHAVIGLVFVVCAIAQQYKRRYSPLIPSIRVR